MKYRHIVEGRWHSPETGRDVVYALCDYEEETSGSGKHAVDVGDEPCPRCEVIAMRQAMRETADEAGMDFDLKPGEELPAEARRKL